MKSATALSFICVIAFACSVKAQDPPVPPNHDAIKAKLGWMIGTWESKTTEGERRQFECKWILDKQVIQGRGMEGTPSKEWLRVFIGWNPVDKKLTVAGITRYGSQTSGDCIRSDDREFHFQVSGVEPAGRNSLILVYARTNDDKLIVEYRDWVIGGEKQEPMKVELTRKKK